MGKQWAEHPSPHMDRGADLGEYCHGVSAARGVRRGQALQSTLQRHACHTATAAAAATAAADGSARRMRSHSDHKDFCRTTLKDEL